MFVCVSVCVYFLSYRYR